MSDGETSMARARLFETASKLDRWSGDPSFMLSMARGLLVLRAVAEGSGRAVSNRELREVTGLSRAALGRCVYTLEALDYVDTTDDGVVPGPEFGALASAYVSSDPRLHAYQPVIRALSNRTGHSVSYGLFEDGAPRAVGIAHCDNPVQLGVTRRDRIPISCSSIGRVMLASMSDEQALERLRQEPLEPRTEHTITSVAQIMEKVAEARRDGFALVDKEAQPDLRSVAVAVDNARGDLVGWMNITVHASMVTLKALRSRIAPEMRIAADDLAKQLP